MLFCISVCILLFFVQNGLSFGYFDQSKEFASWEKKFGSHLKRTRAIWTGLAVKEKEDFSLIRRDKVITLQASRSTFLISSSGKDALARLLGYAMGVGSMLLYSPILLKILKNRSAEGFSLATWVFNLVGCTLAISYPMKKGFPVSTYLELIGATVQIFGILALLCFYQGKLREFSVGVSILTVLFVLFQKQSIIPANLLGSVQIAASIIANYANVPQIILTFQTKKASWSGITALLSMAGCLVRIFTTIQLTNDPFLIMGYLLGVITNTLLFAQVMMYQ